MRTTAAVIGGVTTLVVVVAGILLGLYYGGILSNKAQAHYAKRVVTNQVQQRVRTAEFAQATYEQFFNDCNAVVADKAKIAQAKERVAAIRATPDDALDQKQQQLGQAITDLTGLQQIQAETAARYNANAAEYTRGQFLDASLPPRLDPPYNVTCGGGQ